MLNFCVAFVVVITVIVVVAVVVVIVAVNVVVGAVPVIVNVDVVVFVSCCLIVESFFSSQGNKDLLLFPELA